MKIFKTGMQVTQAVKNIGRLRVILGAFVGHGLEDFVRRMGLRKYIPVRIRSKNVENFSIPVRLRMVFETLGPTFVKLGQLLSNRPDMIPDAFIDEFKKLQDNVAPLSFEIIRKVVEKDLGGPIANHFLEFDEKPLASASISQVHVARLRSGEEVVVKVQRPEIDQILRTDISILRFLAEMMEKYLPETRIIGPVLMVEEFFAVLNYELDFVVEGNAAAKIAQNLKDFPRVIVPRVHRSISTRRVLVMERLKGTRITDVETLKQQGIDPRELVNIGARAFFKMVLRDGLFHGDLHAGNVFALKNAQTGEAQIGMVDFGIVGRLSDRSRDTFIRILFALFTEDFETLCFEYAELGAADTSIDFDGFQREARNAIAPFMGLSLKDVNIGEVLIEGTRIAAKYNIHIPGEWMVVFKAIFTMEGLGRQLDPDFDLLTVGDELVKELVRDRYSLQRLSKDLSFVARDISVLIQTAPRQIRMMFRKFNSNDFAVEVKFREMEVLRRQMERGFRGIGMSLLSGAALIGGALTIHMPEGHKIWGVYPIVSVLLFAVSAMGFLRLVFRSWR